MKITCPIVLATATLLLNTGCKTVSIKNPPTTGEGFVAFDSPRDFDPPGTLYRVDRSGTTWRVGTLNLKPRSGKERTRTVDSKANWSLTTMLKTIGVTAGHWPASAQTELNSSREVSLEGTDVTREWIEDVQEPAKKASELLRTIEYRRDNRYYLIRETQATDNLTFRGDRKWLVKLNIEAELQKALSGNAQYKADRQDTYSIDSHFDHPLRVWYKAERLDPKFGAGSSAGPSLSFQLESTSPEEFHLPASRVAKKP